MTNRDLAGSLIRQAESRTAALRVAVEDENWAYVVRLSQEVVELSLKAILNYAGVEPVQQTPIHASTGSARTGKGQCIQYIFRSP